jgi:DnaK suppressor protein
MNNAQKNGRKHQGKRVTTPFSDKELEHFKQLILEKRQEASEEIERLQAQLSTRENESADGDSPYSFHMADAASDSTDRERAYMMIERQKKLIGYLDRALERIYNKTYGICRVTGKPIDKERLEAIPHTEISIEAKLRSKR